MRGGGTAPFYLAPVGVTAVALWATGVAVSGAGARVAAERGELLAGVSGLLALALKGWAARRSLGAALGVVAGVFGARILVVVVGAVLTAHSRGSGTGYVAGFFATYFVLQWVEIGFLLRQRARLGGGGT